MVTHRPHCLGSVTVFEHSDATSNHRRQAAQIIQKARRQQASIATCVSPKERLSSPRPPLLNKHGTREETHLYSQLGEIKVLLNENPCVALVLTVADWPCSLTIYHLPLLSPSLTPAPCSIAWPAKRDGASLNHNTMFCEIPISPGLFLHMGN